MSNVELSLCFDDVAGLKLRWPSVGELRQERWCESCRKVPVVMTRSVLSYLPRMLPSVSCKENDGQSDDYEAEGWPS